MSPSSTPIGCANRLSFCDHLLLSLGNPEQRSRLVFFCPCPGEHMTPEHPQARKRGGSTRPTSARMLDAAERHRRALDLKVQGWTNERIAAELGYASRGSVTDAIKAAVRDAALPAAK